MTPSSQVTRSLQALSQGHREALDGLMPVVYEELRRIAHRQLRSERAGHTLNTTGLVHEAYLRLVDIRQVDWRDKAHFFAMAARAMRRVLIDYARTRNREKRGGDDVRVSLSEAGLAAIEYSEDLLALDEALSRLERYDARQCRVIEYRCFAGLTIEETATVMETSAATVKRDLAFARAWLNRELGERRS